MKLICFWSVSANDQKQELSGPILYEGRIVDSIVIENRNIYDTNEKKYNRFLFKTANKLHIVTQKNIIKRELLIKVGEPFSQAFAEETERILRQNFVLYDAWIEKELIENEKLLVRVITIDQWSLSTGADLRYAENESRLRIGASEKNLFGRNRLISFYYISQSDDDNYTDASLKDKRILGQKLSGQFSLSSNPLNKFTTVVIEKPFYNLSQRFGFFVVTSNRKGRVDYYINDSLAAQSIYNGNSSNVGLSYRFGSYQQKYQTNLSYSYVEENNSSEMQLSNIAQDSLYHGITFEFDYIFYDYKKKYNIDGFNFTEDFNNGLRLGVSYQNVFAPRLDRKLYDIFTFKLRKSIITENTLLTFQHFLKTWVSSNERIRTLTIFNLKYYNQKNDNITLALNADYRSDGNRELYDFLRLGGSSGIRGADKYFLTGDKRIVLNSEIRFLPRLSVLSFNFGGVLFADFGNIIHTEQDFKFSDTYSSYGSGLRISFDKSSKNMISIDFAYSHTYGWQFTFGSGQYFNASDIF